MTSTRLPWLGQCPPIMYYTIECDAFELIHMAPAPICYLLNQSQEASPGRVAAGSILRFKRGLGLPQQAFLHERPAGTEMEIAMWLATCIACQ